MNKKVIGKKFERKAYRFLKTIFKEVEWLSNKKVSIFDFQCSDGKNILFGDAKFTDYGYPTLSYKQRNADFIVTNKGKNIIFIDKKDFKGKVCISSYDPTHVTVKEETKNRLEKYFMQRKDTYDSVINKLIDLVEEVKKNTK